MSRAITVRVACNDCATERQALPGQPVARLREGLGKVGWKANTEADVDLCPTCVAKRLLKAGSGADDSTGGSTGDSTGGAAS